MKKLKFKITNDFKNSRSRKLFNCESYIARYNDNHVSERFRLFIDREDDRRIVLTFSESEFYSLIQMLIGALPIPTLHIRTWYHFLPFVGNPIKYRADDLLKLDNERDRLLDRLKIIELEKSEIIKELDNRISSEWSVQEIEDAKEKFNQLNS